MNNAFILPFTYAAVNTAGIVAGYAAGLTLTQPAAMLRFINASNTGVQISYDGVTNHDFILPTSTVTLDFQSNNAPNGQMSMIRKGTIIYVAGTAGVGILYITGYYLS